MGADFIIAVDLTTEIIAGKNMKPLLAAEKPGNAEDSTPGMFSRWVGDYRLSMKDIRQKLLAGDNPASAQFRKWISTEEPLPSIFEVLLASSISWKPASPIHACSWTSRISSSSRRWGKSDSWNSSRRGNHRHWLRAHAAATGLAAASSWQRQLVEIRNSIVQHEYPTATNEITMRISHLNATARLLALFALLSSTLFFVAVRET